MEVMEILNKLNNKEGNVLKYNNFLKKSNSKNECYLPLESNEIKIIHLIITRFFIDFYHRNGFPKRMYDEKYIKNAIRVMKKYLITSLENQSCKDFIFVLMLGNKANITNIKYLFNSTNLFKFKIIYEKDIKKYIKIVSKNFEILITTRIDYDDQIYYDAVNDARKAININKPMILYGYKRGVIFFESNNKYYDYYYGNAEGVPSIFISLIVTLNKVNDTYYIYDLGDHSFIRKNFLKTYKLYGIKKLDYEPAVFDSGDPKFIYVRQEYSGAYNYYKLIPKKLKAHNFNLSLFYGGI